MRLARLRCGVGGLLACVLRVLAREVQLGPGDATNVRINDPLPANVQLVSIDPDPTYGMTCNVTTPPQPVVLNAPVV